MLFTHEHDELRRTAKHIADTHINPFVDEWEEAGQYPAHQVIKKLGDAGLLGISRPEEFGGLGLDYSYEVAAAEEMGHIAANGISTSIGVQMNMCTPALAKHGSDALRREWLAPSIAGDLLGCIGVSEEGSGSDVASVKTYAKRDGDDYVINGSKMWITNGIQADWICLLANTSQEGGPHRNKSLIVVPLDSPGIERSKLKKLGLHSSDTAQLFLTMCACLPPTASARKTAASSIRWSSSRKNGSMRSPAHFACWMIASGSRWNIRSSARPLASRS